jgi:hypothetical protein
MFPLKFVIRASALASSRIHGLPIYCDESLVSSVKKDCPKRVAVPLLNFLILDPLSSARAPPQELVSASVSRIIDLGPGSYWRDLLAAMASATQPAIMIKPPSGVIMPSDFNPVAART